MGVYKNNIEPFLLGGMPMLFAPSFWVDPGTNVSTSAGLVTQLVDRAGGFAGTAPTEAKRPELVQGVLNGYPVLRFAGGQVLDFGSAAFNMSSNKSRYAFAVVNFQSNVGTIYAKSKAANEVGRVSLRRGATDITDGRLNSLYQDAGGNRQINALNAPFSGWQVVSQAINQQAGYNRLYLGTASKWQSIILQNGGTATAFRTLVGGYNNRNDDGEELFLVGDLAELVGYDLTTPMTEEQEIYEINRLKRKYNI